MKKRIITIALVAALLATCFAGTYAYLTDTDGATNTMAVGNVTIVQNEKERGENGLVDFVDNNKLLPYTGKVGTNGVASEWGASLTIDGVEYNMFDQGKNAIDKIVTVTNTGSEPAYIRTLLAFEIPKGNEDFVYDRTLNIVAAGTLDDTERTVVIDGVTYAVIETYYTANGSLLAAGATSVPSLRQIYLNANAGNDWLAAVGEEYTILALSQAVQAQGFDDAKTALDTAFGDPRAVEQDELNAWFANCAD